MNPANIRAVVDTNATDPLAVDPGRIDDYLAACVRSATRSQPLPAWPGNLAEPIDRVVQRMSFHGITLILWEAGPIAARWPEALTEAMRQEATAQSFWEPSHRRAIGALIEALSTAGVGALVMKGTALAYSLYANPAARRRGDTDILVPERHKSAARATLLERGFEPVGERLRWQETWQLTSREGFSHLVDLHWRISSSAAISRHLESAGVARERMPIPALSANAVAPPATGNLVLVSINRRMHELYGYIAQGEKVVEGDRLIWAVDIDLLCSTFSEWDWCDLTEKALRAGCPLSVGAGLAFAQRTLGTEVPSLVTEALARGHRSGELDSYLSTASHLDRLLMDIASSPRLSDRAALLASAIAPSPERLRARFPEQRDWPVPLLLARRLFEVLGKIARGKA